MLQLPLSCLTILIIISIFASTVSNITDSSQKPYEANLKIKSNSIVEDTSWTKHELHSSKWSSNPSLSVLRQLIPRCEFMTLDWNNATLGRIRFLHGSELDSLFSPKRQSSSHAHPKQAVLDSAKSQVDCFILFIYSTKCRFSLAAFPYVNALARAYPQIKVIGLPVEEYSNLKWSLRILFVPKLKIIVNGRIYREYMGSDVDLDQMIDFVWRNLNQKPRGPVQMKPSDFRLGWTLEKRTNIWLILSWLTTIVCLLYLYFVSFPQTFRRISNFFHCLAVGRIGVSNPETQIAVAPIHRT